MVKNPVIIKQRKKYMKEIEYRLLGIENLELLVKLRIRDLKMFSNQEIKSSTIENIRCFYKEKMLKDECHTLVGYHSNQIISTATIYYYDILPSNENPKGKVGQITNVWVDENYRHLGVGSHMVKYLIKQYQKEVGFICLNSSKEAMKMYLDIGFEKKDNYLIFNRKLN